MKIYVIHKYVEYEVDKPIMFFLKEEKAISECKKMNDGDKYGAEYDTYPIEVK